MAQHITEQQLTGRSDTHLVDVVPGHRLQAEAAEAFLALRADARDAGFDLTIASSFRSYQRQLLIWNGKARGDRPVHDDEGRDIVLAALSPAQKMRAIMRFSAIPGTSRHHWGTDIDVYDAAAVDPDYRVQLSPGEVARGGVFDPLHSWLDQRMAAQESRGFYRPYSVDRGGVAPERWHLSYAPLAAACEQRLASRLPLPCWRGGDGCEALLLAGEVEDNLADIVSRYLAVPADWCPAQDCERD